MPDTAPIGGTPFVPTTTLPGPAPKVRKPRKKATAPKPERAPRTKPARTLRVRVAELGPTALDAFDLLVKRDAQFSDDVRAALDADDALRAVDAAIEEAQAAVARAAKMQDASKAQYQATLPAIRRLEALAKSLAHAMGDVPDADEDTTFDGSGTPRDTGRSEGDEAL